MRIDLWLVSMWHGYISSGHHISCNFISTLVVDFTNNEWWCLPNSFNPNLYSCSFNCKVVHNVAVVNELSLITVPWPSPAHHTNVLDTFSKHRPIRKKLACPWDILPGFILFAFVHWKMENENSNALKIILGHVCEVKSSDFDVNILTDKLAAM